MARGRRCRGDRRGQRRPQPGGRSRRSEPVERDGRIGTGPGEPRRRPELANEQPRACLVDVAAGGRRDHLGRRDAKDGRPRRRRRCCRGLLHRHEPLPPSARARSRGKRRLLPVRLDPSADNSIARPALSTCSIARRAVTEHERPLRLGELEPRRQSRPTRQAQTDAATAPVAKTSAAAATATTTKPRTTARSPPSAGRPTGRPGPRSPSRSCAAGPACPPAPA